MKSHFEMPGAPKVESLNNLTAGLNRKAAAMLFYQTCGIDTFYVSPRRPFFLKQAAPPFSDPKIISQVSAIINK